MGRMGKWRVEVRNGQCKLETEKYWGRVGPSKTADWIRRWSCILLDVDTTDTYDKGDHGLSVRDHTAQIRQV